MLAIPRSSLIFFLAYFVIMILLGLLRYCMWRRAQQEDTWNGKLAHPSFWKWVLYEEGGFSVYLNWFCLLVFIFNIIRVIVTIFNGFAPF